jgi:hypothetical protein
MEPFLLIAFGITVISFISIALTEPPPTTSPELNAEPTQAELPTEDVAKPRDPSKELEDIASEEAAEEGLVEEEALVSMA